MHGDSRTVDLSVLILAKDEASNLPTVVDDVRGALSQLGVKGQVVIVAADSEDSTVATARELADLSVKQDRHGYGEALKQGFRECRGRWILTLDADGSHPGKTIQQIWDHRTSADIVVASRFVPGASYQAPLFRKVLSVILNKCYRRLCCLPTADSSSGFRLYRRETLDPDRYRCRNFSILQEILCVALSEGFRVEEVPFDYRPRRFGVSKVSFLRFCFSYLNALKRCLLLRWGATAADYDEQAYNSKNLIQRWWQRSRVKKLKRLTKQVLPSDGVGIDIGCGTSRFIIEQSQTIPAEFAFRKLRYLKNSHGKRGVNCSSFSLPFRDRCADLVIHSQVIEHLPKDPVLFREMRRILKTGGFLILGTPDYGRWEWPLIERIYDVLIPWGYADEHISPYTKDELVSILTEHGFAVREFDSILNAELIILAEAVSS